MKKGEQIDEKRMKEIKKEKKGEDENNEERQPVALSFNIPFFFYNFSFLFFFNFFSIFSLASFFTF